MSIIYTRATDLLEAEVGDELVALDAHAGHCFGFNEVATAVWRELEQPRSFDQLKQSLLDRYDVGAEQCAMELQALLDDLAERRLVRAAAAD